MCERRVACDWDQLRKRRTVDHARWQSCCGISRLHSSARRSNHQQPMDEPTIGETVSHYWDHHRNEGGFDGIVAGVRLSRIQKDRALALNPPNSPGSSSTPVRDNRPSPTGQVSGRVNISAGVATGMLIQRTATAYPPVAKAARISGTVVLQATISKSGEIEDLHVISGPAILQQSAMEAVKSWRYRPYVQDGRAVEVETTVNVASTLDP